MGRDVKVRTNLEPEPLAKAIAGIIHSEGLDDLVAERLEKAAPSAVTTRDPYIRELVESLNGEFFEAIEWIRDFVDGRLQISVRKSLLRKAKEYLDGPLTKEQIKEIEQAIRDRFGFIASAMESEEAIIDDLTLERWKALGLIDRKVKAKDFVSLNSDGKLVRNAFIYGRFHIAVEHGATGFEEVMRVALNAPLTKPDKKAIAIAEHQAASYITSFGEKLAGEASAMLREKSKAMVREMVLGIHSRTLEATQASGAGGVNHAARTRTVESWREFASELHGAMADRARDWDKIAFYELNDSKRFGRGLGLLDKYGADKLVYKTPMPTACPQCKALYLEADGATPRLFRLGQMLNHGSNVGRKPMPVRKGVVVAETRPDGAEALKPVAGLVHPYCECGGPNVFTGLEWWADKAKKPA